MNDAAHPDTSDLPTVLIADDDEGMRLMILDALDRGGPPCHAEAYQDGEELWGSLMSGDLGGAGKPALILLDLYMPRRNGHETLQAIRSHPELMGVPVVVLSSSEAQEDADASYRLGASHFAVKPSSFADLRSLIHRLARRWLAPPDDSPGGLRTSSVAG